MTGTRLPWTTDRVTWLAERGDLPHGGGVTDEGTAISSPTGLLPLLRHRLLVVVGASLLLLAACDTGTGDELEPPAAEDPTTEPDPDDPADEDVDTSTEDDEVTVDDDATEEETEDETEDDAEAEGAEPLAGDPATDLHEQEGETGTLAVTDVRIATHEGFDRIVFETEGDGVPGWFVEYAEATAQGSGEEVEVEGDVTLRVAVRMVTLPPDLPEGIEVWDGERLDGPPGGVVLELVEDTIFEGHHTFFVGLDEEHPFVVDLLEDPHRVVVDVHHDA